MYAFEASKLTKDLNLVPTRHEQIGQALASYLHFFTSLKKWWKNKKQSNIVDNGINSVLANHMTKTRKRWFLAYQRCLVCKYHYIVRKEKDWWAMPTHWLGSSKIHHISRNWIVFTIEFYPRKIKWCAAQHIKILMSVAYPNKYIDLLSIIQGRSWQLWLFQIKIIERVKKRETKT